MNPLAHYRMHKKSGMNFRKDVILAIVNENSCNVQSVLNYCININLGSLATIHRELHELIDAKYIATTKSKNDGRIINLKVSGRGYRYLEQFI